jgi:hypothetical protein
MAVDPVFEGAGSRKVIGLILILALLQLAIALLTYGQTLYFDEAIWHYIGRNWIRHGMVPYSGGYDNKSPLIFLIYGLSDMLFGVNYWFPRVLGTLFQSAGIWFLYRTALHLAGQRAGIFVIFLYGLSCLWTSTQGKYVSLTETFEVSVLIAAAYCCVTGKGGKRWFVGGLFAALAIGFRLTAVAGVLSIFIFSLVTSWRYGIYFALGLAAGVAVLAGGLWLAGINLSEVWHYSFLDNVTSSGNGLFQRSFADKFSGLRRGFVFSELVYFYPFVAGYLIVRRKPDWIVCWILGGSLCIYRIGLFDPAHFKDILPPLALASGLFADRLIGRYRLPLSPCLAVIVIWFFPRVTESVDTVRQLLNPMADNPASYCNPPYPPLDNNARKKLGWWIRDHSQETDRLLIPFFSPTVQVYSERLSPSIYFSTNESSQAKERFYQEVREHRPEMVVVPLSEDYRKLVSADTRIFVQRLVDSGYRNDTCMYGYTIYRKVQRN